MTIQDAQRIVTEWQRETATRPCAQCWPQRFDVRAGEPVCLSCGVPESVHLAQRMLQRVTIHA